MNEWDNIHSGNTGSFDNQGSYDQSQPVYGVVHESEDDEPVFDYQTFDNNQGSYDQSQPVYGVIHESGDDFDDQDSFYEAPQQTESFPGSGLMYDRDEVYRNNWFPVYSDEVHEHLGRGSLWSNPSIGKGKEFEIIRGANLVINNPDHPVADDIRAYEGIATSMKTIDLYTPTYQNDPRNIYYVGVRYVDDFFSDKFKDGINTIEGYRLPREQIQGFHLEIAVPFGATRAQKEQIYRLQEYGWEKGVQVYIAEVK
jgi:hypothetical protein